MLVMSTICHFITESRTPDGLIMFIRTVFQNNITYCLITLTLNLIKNAAYAECWIPY